MWRANVLTCVSEGMVEEYRKVFRDPPHVCAYNIIDNALSRKKILEPVDLEWFAQRSTPLVVAAGQLEPWKGFADVIRAMKEVSRRRDARLVIFGEGSLRTELEGLIAELGLSNVVKLPGNVSNPLKYFSRVEVFVSSSYVESMGNALVEAMMWWMHASRHELPDRTAGTLARRQIWLSRRGRRPFSHRGRDRNSAGPADRQGTSGRSGASVRRARCDFTPLCIVGSNRSPTSLPSTNAWPRLRPGNPPEFSR